jgi:hypothetical protein
MTTPIRLLPEDVERWIARSRRLRWLDAATAWLCLWLAALWILGVASARDGAFGATVLLALGLMIRPLRALCRPVSACVGLAVSRGLRAGDRAWYVRPDRVDLVLVTARHGTRLVIATPGFDPDEGLSVRRTRVLLLPFEEARMKRVG